MASSFTQLYFHVIFAVKYRQALIAPNWENQLFNVITAKLQELGHSLIAINGTTDHVHILWRHNRNESLPNTMKLIKGSSSHWINHTIDCPTIFRYQHGYGAFSVSVDRVPQVAAYIRNQKVHHGKKNFLQEYEELLSAHHAEDPTLYQFAPLQ
ncbi:MAG: transposase [Bacteroidota bacterium]